MSPDDPCRTIPALRCPFRSIIPDGILARFEAHGRPEREQVAASWMRLPGRISVDEVALAAVASGPFSRRPCPRASLANPS